MYKLLAYTTVVGCLWTSACQPTTSKQQVNETPSRTPIGMSADTLFITKPIYQQKNTTINATAINKNTSKANSSHKPVLLITGDSMGDGLYLAFLKKAKQSQHYTVKYAPWYGSSTAWWGKTDTLTKIIRHHQPAFVLFTLGTNELFVPNIKSRQKFLDKILSQIDTTEYIWIGPPNWRADTGINQMIATSVGKARFFESKDMQFERRKDGAHPTFKASEYWADSIESWLQKQAVCPPFLKKNGVSTTK